MPTTGQPWHQYIRRYKDGEWRGLIFRDMILDDLLRLENLNGKLTLLDIGCGCGFDSDERLQLSLSQHAGKYIGVEPDLEIELRNIFSKTYRCPFEDAQIDQESIDIGFAVMVLEHFKKPEIFWDKIHKILKKGGVFWGFTVDARHWFVWASIMTEALHIKDWYLNKLHGKRGEERYENYGVFYKSNTPRQIERYTTLFSSRTFVNFYRVGQMDYYIPPQVKWIGRTLDRITISIGLPGSILAVRVEK